MVLWRRAGSFKQWGVNIKSKFCFLRTVCVGQSNILHIVRYRSKKSWMWCYDGQLTVKRWCENRTILQLRCASRALYYEHIWLEANQNYVFSIHWLLKACCWMPLVEQELLTLPEHLSSPLYFSGVRVAVRVLCPCFVDHCSSLCPFWPLCCLSCQSNIQFWEGKLDIIRCTTLYVLTVV